MAIEMRHIDSGWYEISDSDAKRLNGGRLPRSGHEALVLHDGRHWWLARTIVRRGERFERVQVWSIREAPGWMLVNGQAMTDPNHRTNWGSFPLRVGPPILPRLS